MTGEDLKALRKTLGLTQAQMGVKMGLSLRAYTEVENHDGEIRTIHENAARWVQFNLSTSNKIIEEGKNYLASLEDLIAGVERGGVFVREMRDGKEVDTTAEWIKEQRARADSIRETLAPHCAPEHSGDS